MIRFAPVPPWTSSHERLIHAYEQLHQVLARRGLGLLSLRDWLDRKFGEDVPRRLTIAQARQAARCFHAWRAGMEGRAEYRRHPRQERRNAQRKTHAAGNTATSRRTAYAEAIQGTALECLGRVLETESNR